MANPKHVEIVRQGPAAIASWWETNPEERLDLQGADLRGADLRGAHLRGADLQRAHLQRAALQGAHLQRADLRGAHLQRANLQRADLQRANLQRAILLNTNCNNAILSNADLTAAHIDKHTLFDGAIVNSETKGLGPWIFNPEKYIIREIEFPPEYKQAGIGVMNYFAEVLEQKYPDIPVTVQISQEGRKVRMTIESEDGDRDIIEKELDQYGLVIVGQKQPHDLLSDPVHILRLENQLTHVRAQLETERRILQLTERQSTQRIETLENDVAQLRQLVGNRLGHAKQPAESN